MRLLDYRIKWDAPISVYPLFTGTFEFEDAEEALQIEKYISHKNVQLLGMRPRFFACYQGIPKLKEVIFNEPATICIWTDGTKTIVKCEEGDTFDKEKGIALCFMKKINGNKGNYNNIFKKFIKEDEPNGQKTGDAEGSSTKQK